MELVGRSISLDDEGSTISYQKVIFLVYPNNSFDVLLKSLLSYWKKHNRFIQLYKIKIGKN